VTEDCDVIVVGGGSGGCAMAGRLAAAGVRVVLLEAGKSDRNYRLAVPALTSSVVQNPDFDWTYMADPDASVGGRADVWPGGKRLGGGSSINGMMYVRGHRSDYDGWAASGATGWTYDEVVPFFRRMETYLGGGESQWRGHDGPIGVSHSRIHYPIIDDWIRAAEQTGVPRVTDHNGENPGEGTDYAQVTQRNGLRSSATSYLNLPGVRAHLQLKVEAQVARILVEGGRAVGVQYSQAGIGRTLHAKAGVVISAGSLNTPRLLMLSGMGPGDHLLEKGVEVIRNLPGVGANLQEHVGTHLVNQVNTSTINSDARGLSLAYNIMNFAVRRRGILTTAVGHAQAFLKTRPDARVPNIQISFTAFAFDLDANGKLVLRSEPSVSTVVCVARPQSRGRLTLRSRNPADPPRIQHALLGVEDDVDQLVEGLKIARTIMDQPGVSRFVTAEVRPGEGVDGEALKGFARAASIPLYHPVGTCKMGVDSQAVVDPRLAVHGIGSLWIADASIMPTLPVGNTNATAIMIGDKGASHVLEAIKR
jgi:choline dehydrogenase